MLQTLQAELRQLLAVADAPSVLARLKTVLSEDCGCYRAFGVEGSTN
jgi:hypothetical protein